MPPAQNAKPGEKKVEFPNTHCTKKKKIHRHFQAMNENATMEIRLLCQPIMQKARQSLACVQTSPLPQEKSGEETSVNRRR